MSVGPWQVVVIVLVALLLFGGKQLPALGRHLGRGVRQVKRATGLGPRSGQQTDWVAAAGEVRRMAKQVRKATKVGRL